MTDREARHGRKYTSRRIACALSPIPPLPRLYFDAVANGLMSRRMPRPEDVPRDHIDTTVIEFLRGEKDADWTQVSLVTLHPREEIGLVVRENRERYLKTHPARFRELLARLKAQGPLYK